MRSSVVLNPPWVAEWFYVGVGDRAHFSASLKVAAMIREALDEKAASVLVWSFSRKAGLFWPCESIAVIGDAESVCEWSSNFGFQFEVAACWHCA